MLIPNSVTLAPSAPSAPFAAPNLASAGELAPIHRSALVIYEEPCFALRCSD